MFNTFLPIFKKIVIIDAILVVVSIIAEFTLNTCEIYWLGFLFFLLKLFTMWILKWLLPTYLILLFINKLLHGGNLNED